MLHAQVFVALMHTISQDVPFSPERVQRELYGPPVPPMVFAVEAVTNRELLDVPVDVCGRIHEFEWPRGSSVRLKAISSHSRGLLLDPAGDWPAAGEVTCVRGVIYLVDGRSEAEAGHPGGTISHGTLLNRALYRCRELAECQELARTGPRGRRPAR